MFVLVGHLEAVNRKRVKEAVVEFSNFPSLCCRKWVMQLLHWTLDVTRGKWTPWMSSQESWNSFTTSWKTSLNMLSWRPCVSRTWGKWAMPCSSACWASRAWYTEILTNTRAFSPFSDFPACRFDLYRRISVAGGSLRLAARCTFSKHSAQSPR